MRLTPTSVLCRDGFESQNIGSLTSLWTISDIRIEIRPKGQDMLLPLALSLRSAA